MIERVKVEATPRYSNEAVTAGVIAILGMLMFVVGAWMYFGWPVALMIFGAFNFFFFGFLPARKAK